MGTPLTSIGTISHELRFGGESKLIMCEGLHRWMKEYLFVLERKVLLKLEKDLRETKKFKDNGQTLFTTKSGWALKEVHFNLDGADLLD